MTVDPRRIESIVAEVLERLEQSPRPAAASAPAGPPGAGMPAGIRADLDTAGASARSAFEAYDKTPLDTRNRILTSVRETLAASVRTISELAVEETGLGRVEDKVQKNNLVIWKTPGTEDLEPHTWTGDHGLTLAERAPYGPIAVITPVTNPSETIINNAISMIAGGNTVIFCPHPGARRVSNLTIELVYRAAKRAGAPQPLIHSVAEPSIEVAQKPPNYPGIRLNVVTGGPGGVQDGRGAGGEAATPR